jgi:hypothetical protein
VAPANPADAHRPVDRDCDLDAVLSVVDTRQVAADYTIRFQGRMYQIARADVRPGLRGGVVRIEVRLDGSLHARFRRNTSASRSASHSRNNSHPFGRDPVRTHSP